MTDRNTGRNRSRLDLSPVIPWLNTAGSTVPAYGVVQFRDDYVSGYSQATKPNSSTGLFFVNGPVDVANNAHGESLLWDRPRQVLINGTVAVGDEVGPVDGQWYMAAGGTGWRVLHQAVGGVGVVVAVGGGSSGMEIISFSINSSDPLTRSADVEIRQRTFSGPAYGSILDDSVVIVYDTDGCYLNEPNVDLTGRLGKAVLMRVDDEAAATHFADSYEVPEKYWNVLTLCCPHFTCE